MCGVLLKTTSASTWRAARGERREARGEGAVACDRTRLAVAHVYPPSGRECKMKSEKARTHAVLATSTKVSMYRIFTLTAMRFFPEQEVAKEHSVCVCAYV